MRKIQTIFLLILLISSILFTACEKNEQLIPEKNLKNNLKERGLIDDKHKTIYPKLYEDNIAREFYQSPSNIPVY